MYMNKYSASEVFSKETEGWLSESIGQVDSNQVHARVMNDLEAEFHTHTNSDEFFLVLKGQLDIDIEGKTITLLMGDSFTVTSGQKHRARAQGRVELITVILEHA